MISDSTNNKDLISELDDFKKRYKALEVLYQNTITDQKESEIRLASVFRAAPTGIGVVIDRIIKEANLKLAEITGYSQEELIGANSRILYPSEEEFNYVGDEKYRQIGEHGSGVVETKWIKKDGIIIDILLASTPLEVSNLKKGVTFTALDISNIKKAEESLRQSEYFLKKAQEIAHIGSWSLDALTGELVWSDEIFRIFGLSKSDFIVTYDSFLDIVHPDDRDAVNKEFQTSLENGNDGYEIEHRIIKPDSCEVRYVIERCEHHRGPTGKIIRSVGMVQDITEIKKSQEKIREQYSLLKIAGERVKLGGWSYHIDENKLYWSEEVAIIHETEPGFTPDVNSGINFYAPEWREIITDKFNRCVRFGEPYDLELQIISAHGKKLWVRTIAEAVKDSSGRIYMVQGAFQDITDIRDAREKVREKDIQFRKLSANVSDLIYQFTRKPDGTYSVPIASEGIKNIFGCTPEEVTDNFEPIARVIHPDDMERVISDIEYSAAHLTYFTCEFRVVIPGKPVQWIFSRSTPELLPDGSVTWYGFNANITERKHAEEELRKLSRAVEQSLNAVIIAKINGDIEYANPAASVLTGFSNKELLTKNIRQLCTATGSGMSCDDVWKRINSGEAWTGEVLNIRKKGEEYWESSIISPIFNEKGSLVNFLSIKKDITRDKIMSEELVKAKEKAEESDKLKTAFLSNMSHEIRTPMNGILGFAELLKEPGLSHEQILEYVKIIEKGGQRMLNIINDITDIARIESGQMKINLHDSNVNEIIKEAYRFFKPEAETKGLNLVFSSDLDGGESIIKTDRDKLYAVISNLVKNSLKFTTSGSIQLGYVKKGEFLEFFVKDTGIGIPQDKQKVVFDRFVQADMSNSRFTEGTGLGLSISKAFIEMLGGKIWLESEEGRGSEFYFTIPYSR